MTLKFSCSLTFLFTEVPFLERFERAAAAGFRAVEYMFPYGYEIPAIRECLERFGLQQALFNLPAGNWDAGDRGIAVDPDRRQEFREGVHRALEVAEQLNCPRLNCLVGKRREDLPYEEQWAVLVENMRYAAEVVGGAGRTLLVEPLNTYDIPGFFLTTTREALRLIEEVGHPALKLQYDVYHMQRMEGNLTWTLRTHLSRIGHIQIADVPDRHQPGTGEIHFPFLLRELERLGYDGYVGLEYVPLGGTEASLRWMEEMGFPLEVTR